MTEFITTKLRWPTAFVFIACYLCVFQFLRDAVSLHWVAWVLAPALALGNYALAFRIDERSRMRAVLLHVLMVTVVFAAIYDALDFLVGPDWPLWIIVPLLVAGLWWAFWSLASLEDD